MLRNFVILVFLLLGTLLLLKKSLGISLGSLLHQQVDLLSLGLMSDFIFQSHLCDISLKLNLLLISEFLLLHSNNSSLLDLVDDYLSSLLPSLELTDLSLLLLLKNLKSLNFHHKIELLLLLDPLRFETLVLCKLLITNSNDFRVENHLIHLLNIIKLIIKHLLCLRKKRLILRHLIRLLFCGLHFLRSSLIHFDHLFLLSLRLRKCCSFLLVSQSLFLQELVFSFDSGCILDSIQVIFGNDDRVVLVVLLSLLPNGSQLVHSDEACGGADTGWEFACFGAGAFGSTNIGTFLISK